MAKRSRQSRVVRQSRKKTSLLESLKPEEAQTVLGRLLAIRAGLRAEAERIARSVLAGVSFEAVADQVEEAVRDLDLDDLRGRSGSHAWGYVEPTEAAWEILEEAVAPFLEDMKRQIGLGLETEALEICKGIVLGLYRLRESKSDELLGWAPDFPEEAAGDAIEAWRTAGRSRKGGARTSGRKRQTFPSAFVRESVPEWTPFLTRLLSRGHG